MNRNEYTVSAKMASKITGIGYCTILNHIKKGILPTVKDSPRYKVDLSDLEAYAYAMYEVKRYTMYDPLDFGKRMNFYVYHEWID